MNLTIENYNHKANIAVRYGDMDWFRHLNNAKYLTYLEEARVAYARDVLGWDCNLYHLNMIVANVSINYLRPILYNDTVVIYTRMAKIGSKSLTMEFLFVRENENNEIAAHAQVTLVCFDYNLGTTIPVSEEMKSRVEKFEAKI